MRRVRICMAVITQSCVMVCCMCGCSGWYQWSEMKLLLTPAISIGIIMYIMNVSIMKQIEQRSGSAGDSKPAPATASAASSSSTGAATATAPLPAVPSAASITVAAASTSAAPTVLSNSSGSLNFNQELFAFGMANFVGGFFQCYPSGLLLACVLPWTSENMHLLLIT